MNINTASAEDLTSLKGIGEKTAQAIVEYREKNGAFKAIEDIKNVKGIGDKKFEVIKGSICVK
ncbi:MAG: helix-hairpin-helix domain-containing protein [Thermodesulfobacteriota bacterium]|nr:MAG: helix-hairpin-helix domain-containing protein [Thermodesulfobacteriota bacterium]